MGLVSSWKIVIGCNSLITSRLFRKDYNKDLITFIRVTWALCGFGRKGIKRARETLGRRIMILVWSGLWDSSFGKCGVCNIKERRREYWSKLYFYSCNVKGLMECHTVLLVFYFTWSMLNSGGGQYIIRFIVFCYVLCNSYLFLL